MKHVVSTWLVVLFLAGGTVDAVAQNIGRTTGTLRGTVKDESGGVVPGATVTVASPALGGTRVAISDGKGEFEVPALTPGIYSLRGELSGFSPQLFEGLDLKVGQTLRVDLTLKPGLTETVIVAGNAIVDVVSVEQSNDISAATFNELPKGRSWDSIVELAPSVNTEDLNRTKGLSFQGASVHENVYIVDGVDVTETAFASQGQDIVFEFLENIQVKSGFSSAEYGGALGGVVNMQTKSGSNLLKGGVTFQASGSSLSEGPRRRLRVVPTDSTKADYVQDLEDDSTTLNVGGFVGGPVRKDQLFFFAGFIPEFTDTSRTVTFLPSSVIKTLDSSTSRPYLSTKVTWKAGTSLNVNGSYQMAPRTDSGRLPSLDGIDDPNIDFASLGTKRDRTSYAANVDWVATPDLFVNAFAGYYTQRGGSTGVPVGDRFRCATTNLGLVPLNGAAPVPADLQCTAGFQTLLDNNPTLKDWNDRLSMGVVGTLNFKAGGNHTMRMGAQYALPESTTDTRLTGERVDLHWGASQIGIRGDYGYWRNISISNIGSSKSHNAAIFVQDQWTTGRFTLNLGLRMENERDLPLRASSDQTTKDIVFGWTDKMAPRVGVAWDVKGDSTWRVYANAGYFYDVLKQSATQLLFGSRVFKFDYYRLDTANWKSLGNKAAAAAGAPFFVLNFGGAAAYVPPDTKPTRSDEFAMGTDYALGNQWSVAAQYQHRALQNAIEDFDVTPVIVNGVSYTKVLGNPGRGILAQPFAGKPPLPDFERAYDGLTLELAKRLSNRWAMNTSYTYSRLFGNYEGLGDSDEQVLGGGNPNSGRYCTTLEGCYTAAGKVDTGRLTLDRPHQFKFNGSYALTAGLSAGGFFRAESGTPVTPQMGVNQSAVTHPEGRGSRGRTDAFTQTDLFVQYGFKVKGQSRAVFSANIINVFNQSAVRGYFPGVLAGSSATTAIPAAQYFAGYDFNAVLNAIPLTSRDPRFLMAQAYQAPRALRLGIRLDF